MLHEEQAPGETPAESDSLEEVAAFGRAMVERLLDAAERDAEWRRAFERALRAEKLHRGSAPNKVWQSGSMLRQRFVAECQANGGIRLLAATCPPVARTLKPGRPLGTADIRRVIAEHGPVPGYLCATEAHELGLLKSPKALKVSIEAIVEEMQRLDAEVASETHGERSGAADTAVVEKPHSDTSQTRRLRHDNKILARDLEAAKKQIGQLTRKNQELEQRLAETLRDLRSVAEHRTDVTNRLGELQRETASLREQVDELKKAKATLEARLEEQRAAAAEERLTLRERLAAAEATARAHAARANTLERQLGYETRRRKQVEALVAETGLQRLLEGLGELEGVIAALEAFRAGIAAYQQRLAAEEQRRRLKVEELKRRSAEAEAARRKQAEMEAVWRERELERLANLERKVFGSPPPDTILIDGHNAVIRAFGREREREKRPWFIEAVRLMAHRMSEVSPQTRIVLCFDTSTHDNVQVEEPNFTVRFCDKQRGGADGAIKDMLESANPAARHLVISSDRRHVWRDALNARAELDSRVSIADAEVLLDYLSVLEQHPTTAE
ncbi:MAG: hypothetical protein N3B11_06155 [Coriobacteriia bacterium]|nr:hypothetical protein [Coriobacteriia bacterium]